MAVDSCDGPSCTPYLRVLQSPGGGQQGLSQRNEPDVPALRASCSGGRAGARLQPGACPVHPGPCNVAVVFAEGRNQTTRDLYLQGMLFQGESLGELPGDQHPPWALTWAKSGRQGSTSPWVPFGGEPWVRATSGSTTTEPMEQALTLPSACQVWIESLNEPPPPL